MVVGDNYSLSANVVNTFRVTYTRMRDNRFAAPNLFTLASARVNIFQCDPTLHQILSGSQWRLFLRLRQLRHVALQP